MVRLEQYYREKVIPRLREDLKEAGLVVAGVEGVDDVADQRFAGEFKRRLEVAHAGGESGGEDDGGKRGHGE